jgi:hypothetical protein
LRRSQFHIWNSSAVLPISFESDAANDIKIAWKCPPEALLIEMRSTTPRASFVHRVEARLRDSGLSFAITSLAFVPCRGLTPCGKPLLQRERDRVNSEIADYIKLNDHALSAMQAISRALTQLSDAIQKRQA